MSCVSFIYLYFEKVSHTSQVNLKLHSRDDLELLNLLPLLSAEFIDRSHRLSLCHARAHPGPCTC